MDTTPTWTAKASAITLTDHLTLAQVIALNPADRDYLIKTFHQWDHPRSVASWLFDLGPGQYIERAEDDPDAYFALVRCMEQVLKLAGWPTDHEVTLALVVEDSDPGALARVQIQELRRHRSELLAQMRDFQAFVEGYRKTA